MQLLNFYLLHRRRFAAMAGDLLEKLVCLQKLAGQNGIVRVYYMV